VSFKNVLATTFVGYLINNITPIGVAGGEPVKAYILSKKEGITKEKVFSSVIVDLFIEIIPLFFLSAVAIFIIIVSGISMEIAAVIGFASLILLVLFGVCLTFVMNKALSYQIIKLVVGVLTRMPFLSRKAGAIKSEAESVYEKFNDAIKKQMLDNYIIYFGTFISMTVWILRMLRVYLIFLAFGTSVPLAALVVVETAVVVVTFIPISPGALGVWEAASITLFVLLGGGASPPISAATATSVMIIDRIIFYIFPSVLGILAALYLGVDVSRLIGKEVSDKVDMDNVSKVIGGEAGN
jgi:glycosyltransferase 2 family protein